jgi:hypothetical protein
MMQIFDFGFAEYIEPPKAPLQDAAITQNSEAEGLKNQIIQQAASRQTVQVRTETHFSGNRALLYCVYQDFASDFVCG